MLTVMFFFSLLLLFYFYFLNGEAFETFIYKAHTYVIYCSTHPSLNVVYVEVTIIAQINNRITLNTTVSTNDRSTSELDITVFT